MTLSRRDVLGLSAGLAVLVTTRPVRAQPGDLAAAIRSFAGAAIPRDGKVSLDLPPLVENGNVVAMTVRVDSPMTEADHVRRIGVFAEKNPQPFVGIYHLGPLSGRAAVSSRLRLADSQVVVAVAELSDGTFWQTTAEVIVTLAACVEG